MIKKDPENIDTYIWKSWYYKKLLSKKNQLKCGGYSILFSMHADDDEQYFN